MSSPSHVPLANLSRGRGRGDRPPVSPHFDLRDSNRPLVTPVAVTAGQSAFNLFPEDQDGGSALGSTSPYAAAGANAKPSRPSRHFEDEMDRQRERQRKQQSRKRDTRQAEVAASNYQSQDTLEYLAQEKKARLKKELWRQYGYQMMTLLLCTIKLYVISVIQGSMTIYNSTFGKESALLKLTFLFGLFIIGNVIDNVSHPKQVIISLQIILGVAWTLSGEIVRKAQMIIDSPSHESFQSFKEIYLINSNLCQFLGSGIVLLNIIQLSNWFTQRNINKVLAIYLMSQIAGYETPLAWIDQLFYSAQPWTYYASAFLMVILSVIDYYFFAFHPLQKNLLIDQALEYGSDQRNLLSKAQSRYRNNRSGSSNTKSIVETELVGDSVIEQQVAMHQRDQKFNSSLQQNSFADSQINLTNQQKNNLVINKQTFNTLRTIGEKSGQKNIYEIVYSKKRKALKDDDRLAYYSFLAPLKYTEMYYLTSFSILYVASSNTNVELARPRDTTLEWPFDCYAYGTLVGLIVILFVSDFLFQKRMLFLPCFVYALCSVVFHICLLFLNIFTDQLEEQYTKEWVMGCEGFLDDQVQFYCLYIAPIQVARIYRLTQEINPAGTLISVNQVASIFAGNLIHYSFQTISGKAGWSDSVERAFAIIILIIGVLIIYPSVKKEFKDGSREQQRGGSGNEEYANLDCYQSKDESVVGGAGDLSIRSQSLSYQ